jgi:hypothetical protein
MDGSSCASKARPRVRVVQALAVTTIAAVFGLFSRGTIHAEGSKMSARPDSVSLFQVPLRCPAAPEIACGSRARPILLALEGESGISEAWVNGIGTELAVVGTENSSPESRAKTVVVLLESVFGENSATEIQDQARERGLESFLSGSGWYRGAQVDSLSEVEAGIIAARLLRRLHGRVTLSDTTAKTLEIAFIEAFKRRFIRRAGQAKPTEGSRFEDDLLSAARTHLDEKGFAAFQQSIAKGYQPEPNEKWVFRRSCG